MTKTDHAVSAIDIGGFDRRLYLHGTCATCPGSRAAGPGGLDGGHKQRLIGPDETHPDRFKADTSTTTIWTEPRPHWTDR